MSMNMPDNTIETLLGEAGVNQSASHVYQAGLNAARSSAQLLAETGMPRPTLMAALHSLRNYGLCEAHRLDGRSLVYTMLPLANLKAHLGQQIRSIDNIIERLNTVRESNTGVTVQTSTGQQSLQDYLEVALRCKSRKWQIIAPKDNALSHLPTTYLSYFKRVRKERQIQSETLWEAQASDQKIALADILMRKPRYVPQSIRSKIPSMLLAFDDSLLIIDGTTQPSIVLLTGESVVATVGLLFDMAWRFARTN